MAEDGVNLQHYQGCALGQALKEAIDELRANGTMEDHHENIVLGCFDKSITDSLGGDGIFKKSEELEEWYGRTKLTIKGHLQMFRGVDNVWTLVLTEGKTGNRAGDNRKVSIRVEPGDTEYNVDALKIVAMQRAEP
mmetsp:Transcript_1842/g.5576  ORF Transcript_1842/g.5576 Transcript_1842/m.5576 type:complete len:136 (+) Transcript_1842:122-529(+)